MLVFPLPPPREKMMRRQAGKEGEFAEEVLTTMLCGCLNLLYAGVVVECGLWPPTAAQRRVHDRARCPSTGA